jgi:hypothetical protein
MSPSLDATPPRFAHHRGTWDFVSEESHRPAERNLSSKVSTVDREAVTAAWRGGDYASVAKIAAAWSERDDRRQILLPLIADWVTATPEAAASFAQAWPAGTERRLLLEAAVRSWSERDVAAASAWLNALEPHPDHDGAVVAIATCEVLSTRRPEIALSWAESVMAPTPRWEAICTVAETWARRDESAARRYVESCVVLTVREREQMLTHISQSLAVLE